MRLTKSKPIPAAVDPSILPAGHDVEGSPHYVPEELRSFYVDAVLDVPEHKWHSLVEDASKDRAYAELRAEIAATRTKGEPVDVWEEHVKAKSGHEERAEQLVEASYAEILADVKHALRLSEAQSAQMAAATRAENDTFARTLGTCPVCHTFDPGRIGVPDNRSLLGVSAEVTFRACAACYQVAAAEILAQLTAEQDPTAPARTRRDQVRAALGF